MRTVALALPGNMRPEMDPVFADWCRENAIEAWCTRLHAEYDGQVSYFLIWNIDATDAQLVLTKLRWQEEMAPEDWWCVEKDMGMSVALDYEVEEKL